jgi:hypothetical protein
MTKQQYNEFCKMVGKKRLSIREKFLTKHTFTPINGKFDGEFEYMMDCIKERYEENVEHNLEN